MKSCLEGSDCLYNVFQDEDLYMEAIIDDELLQVDDSVENRIYPSLRYQVDSTREDTLIFYYDCNYFFNDGSEIVSLTIMKYASFGEVFNYGNGLLNYAPFDSLGYEGDYSYVKRIPYLPEHGVDVRYFRNDSMIYFVDQSGSHPEDFYFHAENFIRKNDVDCYGRNIMWFNFTGNFGCRLVEQESKDTLVIRDAEFRGVIMQFRYSTF
ncbi:MAG: hypothetical protein JXR52_06120 [Bacteroidales bacterium]|nr:hypothetical protein [Bacteroidales bacterium]MBN2698383.1 hypothetical protein [Bacteroidales bacterium]